MLINTNGNSAQPLTAGKTIEVRVSAWRMGEENSNHSIAAILKNQGYSNKEIYKETLEGTSLLTKVAKLNNLKYPNLLKAGEILRVPARA